MKTARFRELERIPQRDPFCAAIIPRPPRNAIQMGSPMDNLNPAAAQPLGLVLAKIARGLGSHELPSVSEYDGDYELPFGQRFALLGYDWTYCTSPMGELFYVNGNCADASAGSSGNQIDAILAGADVWTAENLGFAFPESTKIRLG